VNDIFLSYAREDVQIAKSLAAALEKQGWSVFWDRASIFAGQDFDLVIETEIESAKCMIVLWSAASKKSDYVRDEARLGKEKGMLVPVLIASTSPPLGFGSIHSEDFSNWNGATDSVEFTKLKAAVVRLLKSENANSQTANNAVNQPESFNSPATNSIILPEMLNIPAGRFLMGSNTSIDDEIPVHLVTLPSFNLGKYPVTFAEYDRYAEAVNVSKPEDQGWGRGKRPVIDVSWNDAVAYCQWLTAQTGKTYRLPSEAEWEYACQAGTTTDYYWGAEDAKAYAWFNENSQDKTQPVVEKKSNAFGLYDMSGNVWEWVQDNWHESYEGAPEDGSAWKSAANAPRVVRGGSWGGRLHKLRSARRGWSDPDNRSDNLGFRLAQD